MAQAASPKNGQSDRSMRIIARTLLGSSALFALMTASQAQAQSVVSACSGVSLPRSVVTDIVAPVVTGISSKTENTVNGILNLPLLGLLPPDLNINVTGLLNQAAAGDDITLKVLALDGTVVGPDDQCRLTSDSFTLDTAAGMAIGGNQISGLGANGAPAFASDINAIAFGNNARAELGATRSIALGFNSSVTAANSIALGAGSIASRGAQAGYAATGLAGLQNSVGEFSIGAPGALRQLTNVAAGTAASDVATVGQLNGVAALVAAVDAAGIGYDDLTHGRITLDGALGTTIAGLAPGALNATSTEAVTGAQLQATNQLVGANTAGIAALDTRVTAGSAALAALDAVAIRYDGAGQSAITFGGLGGTALNNVAPGALTAASKQAVNGAQLFATNGLVAGNTAAISALGGRVTTAEGAVAGLTTGLGTTNATVSGLTSGLAATNVTVSGLQGDLATTNANLAATNATVGGLTTGLASTNANVAGLTSGLSATNATVAGLGTDLATTNVTVSGLQGSLATTNANVAANTAAVGGLTTGLAATDANVSGLTSGLAATNATVAGLQSGLSGTNASLASLTTQVDGNTAAIGTLQSGLTATNASIAATDANVAGLTTGLATTNANLAGLTTQVSSNTSALATMQADLADTDATVDMLVIQVGGNTAAIGTLQGGLAATNANLAATDANVAGLTTGLATTNANLTGLTTQVGGNSAAIGTLQTGLAANDASLAGLTTQVGSNTSALGTLQGDLALTNTAVSTLTTQVDGNAATLTTLQGNLATTNTAVNDLAGQVGGHTTAITNLETSVTGTNTNVANLSMQVADHTSEITQINAALANQPIHFADAADPTVPNGGTMTDDVTLAGASGSTVRLHNLRAGLVAAGSTDAVNGDQLADTNAHLASTDMQVATNSAAIVTLGNFIAGSGISPLQYSSPEAPTAPNGGIFTNHVTLVGANLTAPVAIHNVANGSVAAGSTDAVNGGQLFATDQIARQAAAMSANSVQYDAGGQAVTFGGEGAAPTRLSNVAEGVNATDAVNVGQLQAAVSSFEDQGGLMESRFRVAMQELNFSLADLKPQIGAGTSSALAAAALPQANEPGKSMISIGGGTYRGQTAVAFGASAFLNDGHSIVRLGATYDSKGYAGANAGFGYQF